MEFNTTQLATALAPGSFAQLLENCNLFHSDAVSIRRPKNCTSSWNLSWELRAIFEGHFRAPLSADTLVSGAACEPHVNNFSGAFLFTMDGP